MLYAIVTEDTPNSLEKRIANRPAHFARITELHNQGRLVIAGPLPAIDSVDPGPAGFTGSLIVAEFKHLETATAWANDDPFVHTGVYAKVIVKPFRQSLP